MGETNWKQLNGEGQSESVGALWPETIGEGAMGMRGWGRSPERVSMAMKDEWTLRGRVYRSPGYDGTWGWVISEPVRDPSNHGFRREGGR